MTTGELLSQAVICCLAQTLICNYESRNYESR
jgi:hypothetical protein